MCRVWHCSGALFTPELGDVRLCIDCVIRFVIFPLVLVYIEFVLL